MSNLVAEFLINPVLRQARRFSNTINERIDLTTTQRAHRDQSPLRHGRNFSEEDGRMVVETAEGNHGDVSGGDIMSSPADEDGGLEAELGAIDSSRNIAGTVEPRSPTPRRLATYHSDRMSVDNEMSDNPLFGTPIRFQTSFNSRDYNHGTSNAGTSRSSTQDGTQHTALGSSTRQRGGSLPEDDGMSALRRRILSIQERDISASEKAGLVHKILIEGYSYSQTKSQAKCIPRAPSPASMVSQDRPTTPGSLSSFSFWQATTNDTPPSSSPSASHTTFSLSQADLKPTYAPVEPHQAGSSDSEESEDNKSAQSLGCCHYKRNVKLQCFTCNGWYTCRFCHDEVEDHVLNRKETRNMLCMLCGCAQRASDLCVGCGSRAAWYFCGICKLWDDDANKSIYHCADCGICRVGRGLGKDFIHCKTCGVCVSIANENSHKCIERATDCDCPICGEYLFSSLQAVVFMKCGHSIHRKCLDELMKTTYKCPICSQSVVNMEYQFHNLDRAIETQPMPPQFQDTKAIVSCNDCYAKSLVKYHWLGLKCAICDSYNTAQLQILSDTESAGPTEASIEDNLRTEAAAGNDSSVDQRARFPSDAGTATSRRHSLHTRPGHTETSSLLFTPYHVPPRVGRSVSPFRTQTFCPDPVSGVESLSESDEEDDIEFWGGDAPRSAAPDEDAMEEDDESDSDSAISVEEDEDDGNEEDRMDLIGHR